MQLDKKSILEIAEAVVNILEKRGVIGGSESNTSANSKTNSKVSDKSAYAKTESLLFSYVGLKKIVDDRMQEIEEIRKYGVPKNCGVAEYVQKGGLPQGIVLEEETVESAVQRILCSVQDTVHVISLIDKSMASLKDDPYHKILEMRYFEGRTQEDIAIELGCTQGTIARNKSRLVRKLAMQMFPDQVARELMK